MTTRTSAPVCGTTALSSFALLPFVLLTSACIQSVHGEGPSDSPPPHGEVRILEERSGGGRAVAFGDRVRVDLVGKYASGEVWGQGPLTFIVGPGTYPGMAGTLRVGSVIRMQYLASPNDTTARLVPFPGLDTENEAYQVRRDRGPIIVEHTVRRVCRPMMVFFFNTGLGPIESELGCWIVFRLPRRFGSGVGATGGGEVYDPPPARRAVADTLRYTGEDGLRQAAREGRPELVGWLIARGGDPSARDSTGFAPIHYVGWAQRPLEGFVPALEQSYVDVLDTLMAHGVAVDERVGHGPRASPTLPESEHEGQTALGFAAPECADKLVARLLELGADPDRLDSHSTPAVTSAAMNGCPETVELLLAAGAQVDLDPTGGGTPAERVAMVSAFHVGHLESARALVSAGAQTYVAVQRIEDRLRDPGTGGFGFSNRPMARRILELYRGAAR